MTSQTVTILCGKCRVGMEGPAEPKDHDMLSCPSCGRSATFKDVMASVTAFSEELVAEKFNKMLVDTLKPRKLVKVTGHLKKKGVHPFITNMKI